MRTLRQQIAYIPQMPFLMTGTLRENLDPYGKSSDAELWTVLDDVALKEHVETLSDGLQTVVVDSKGIFSVG